MFDYKEQYHNWCTNPYFDQEVREELAGISDQEEIKDRFDRELEFGTGGLRGVMGAGLNRMNRYTVRKATQGLANYLNRQEGKAKKAVIAYDSRHRSREFATEAALCLCANGITVFLFEDLRPTPELSFAVRELGCTAGIVITASHNPPEYNGYKVYLEDGAQITAPKDREIIREVKAVTDFTAVKSMTKEEADRLGLLSIIGEEMDRRYIDALKKLITEPDILREEAKNLKIVYTPLHGTGNLWVRRILKELGFEQVFVVEEQAAPDGDFPTVESPNPEDKRAFAMALQLAEKVDADLVLATDPDADRMGLYGKDKKSGKYMEFTGNMSGMILCEYLLNRRRERGELAGNGAVVTTIVSGKMAGAVCREYGAKRIETLTGFKYIGEQIRLFEETHEHEYLFGFEESYGCLVGTNSRDKDAVGAVMALCEAAAYYKSKGLTLWDQMVHLYEKYGYYTESLHTVVKKGTDGQAQIGRLIEKMRRQPFKSLGGKRVLEFRDYREGQKVLLADGRKEKTGLPLSDVLYYALEDEAWACIRPSGTEPKVKIYLGAREDSLEHSREQLSMMWKDIERGYERTIKHEKRR